MEPMLEGPSNRYLKDNLDREAQSRTCYFASNTKVNMQASGITNINQFHINKQLKVGSNAPSSGYTSE